MASTINATSTSNGGLISTGDDSGILNIQTNETTAVTIDASQNVGIGTSSPSAKLDVAGSIAAASATFSNFGSATTAVVGLGNGNTGLFRPAANTIGFTANGSERARIDSSGSLLVGTTSPAAGQTHTIRSVNSDVSSFGLAVQHTASNADVRGVLVACPNYNGDDGYLFIAARSGGDRLYIRSSGNVQNSNNSYGAISDVKLKENITDATPKLEKINQVRVVNYNLIGDAQKQIGVIAQELEQIFPSMVEESVDRDAEGNDLGTTTKAVKYSVFVPMLIKAIQEQQALITTLTERITALEAK